MPPNSEPSRLRASDADRDRTLDVLRAAAGDGRLTAEEFGERMEAALSARTLGELAALTADLATPTTSSASGGRAAGPSAHWPHPHQIRSPVRMNLTFAWKIRA